MLVESNHIEPIICISKVDLLSQQQKQEIEQYAEEYRKIGYEVILTSTVTEKGMEQIQPLFEDRVTVIAGQSGVGKSSLLNTLKPELELKTNDISMSLGRGKHTTRHVELISFGEGLVADTPGFSSLEFLTLEVEELTDCFPEMSRLSEQCKFRGCLHVKEPKCAVKEAYEQKEIPSYRYEHYLQFVEEIKQRKPRY